MKVFRNCDRNVNHLGMRTRSLDNQLKKMTGRGTITNQIKRIIKQRLYQQRKAMKNEPDERNNLKGLRTDNQIYFIKWISG